MKSGVTASAALTAGLLVVGCIAGAQHNNREMPAQDRRFLWKAAQSGLSEVQEGQAALNNAAGERVKTFAQHMIDDHTKANDRLQEIASRLNARIPDHPSSEQQADIERLQSLHGGAFDRFYMRHEISDHEAAVALFQSEANNGQIPELRRFARRTLPTLQMHLQMARDSRGSWRAHRRMDDDR